MSAAVPPPQGPDVPGAPAPVPEELAVVPPGAVLAELLEDLDIERVCGYDTVEVLCAEYRQLCRQQARFYRAVLETGLRTPFSISTVQRVSTPGEFAAEEARAALVWSRARAERAFGLAHDLFCRLPQLGEAMLAGRLDEPRARAFLDWTSGLTDAQADTICDQLLPQAAGLMVGELIDRIKRACLAIDPNWAEKRYREALRTRRVHGSRNPDGTANLGAYQQPIDRIAAAADRIDTLARACKHAGDHRPIDLIRSDLFLGMTDGTYEAMTEDEIITHVLTHPYTEPTDPDSGDGDGGGGNTGGDGHRGSDDGGPGGSSCGGGEPGGPAGSEGPTGRAPGSPTRGEPPGGDAAGPRVPSDSTAGPPAHDQTTSGDEPACGDGGTTSDEATDNPRATPDDAVGVPAPSGSAQLPNGGLNAAAAGRSPTRWSAPEVRIELGTLLGLDEHPGEIPPWGFVPAAHARRLVDGMHSAEWRYVFCDPDGRATGGGLLRARPAATSGGAPARRDPKCGGIVEIAVPADHLGRIIATQATSSRWQPVLVELARHAEQRGRDPNTHPGTDTDTEASDTSRRTPGAALRRWIQLRDRQCVHPCCRAPARTTDQDHRIGHAHGGPTSATNLSTPCRHDHRLKDEGGWAIHQPEPGVTVWTSPLGHRYQSQRPPVIPAVPAPYPDDQRRLDEPVGLYVWVSSTESCDCDEPCHCQPQILPPVPTRTPRQEPDPDPRPTAIFDPNETFPF